jgi:hypothetical protein
VDVGLLATQILLLFELVGDGKRADSQYGHDRYAKQHFDQ